MLWIRDFKRFLSSKVPKAVATESWKRWSLQRQTRIPPSDNEATLNSSQRPPSDIQTLINVLGTLLKGRPNGFHHLIDLGRTDLRGVHLSPDAHLEGVSLGGAHLEEATLYKAHLQGADLREAHLEKANLREVHLEGAYLDRAYLKETKLSSAHLEGAKLPMAQLERASLRETHLEGANLYGAYLDEANLYRTHLEGADLRNAHGLTYAQIKRAYGDEKTDLPVGLQRPTFWGKDTKEQTYGDSANYKTMTDD